MTASLPEMGIHYVELGVQGIPETKRFYGEAFGWEFTDYGPTYSSFSSTGLDGGFDADNKLIGKPLVILYSAKLEEAQTRVEKAGGKIVKPIFSFPGGRRFHFADPSGNELAIWSDQ